MSMKYSKREKIGILEWLIINMVIHEGLWIDLQTQKVLLKLWNEASSIM